VTDGPSTADPIEVRVTDPSEPAARACLAAYFAELVERFDTGFDPELSIPAEDPDLVLPAGLLLVAFRGDQALACGALKLHGQAPCELKRMWVAPAARGLGLGRRLLAELEARALAAGARVVRLETNRSLTEAIALYRSCGYTEVAAFNDEPYAHHWFEKRIG
jgi:ribosomal protein S18 acetylase RimI-like enzyme